MIRCYTFHGGVNWDGDRHSRESALGSIQPASCVQKVTLMLNRFSLTPRAIPFKISVALVLLSGALFAGIAAQVVGNGALVHLDLAIYQQLRAYNYSPIDDAL